MAVPDLTVSAPVCGVTRMDLWLDHGGERTFECTHPEHWAGLEDKGWFDWDDAVAVCRSDLGSRECQLDPHGPDVEHDWTFGYADDAL